MTIIVTGEQSVESSTKPRTRRSKWRAIRDSVSRFMAKAASRVSRKKAKIPDKNTDTSASGARLDSGQKLSGKWTRDQFEQPGEVEQANKVVAANEAEQRYSGVNRSNTAPIFSAGILPIAVPTQRRSAGMPTEKTSAAGSMDRPYPWSKERNLRVTTIHLHLDEGKTEICRCMLDTGADLNFVSQKTLLNSQLQFVPRVPPEVPSVTGLGGDRIVPLGSIRLTWHVDTHTENIYSDEFWIIADSMRPPFDVLLGHQWIMEQGAFQPNPNVLLANLGFHPSSTPRVMALESQLGGPQ